MAYASHFKHADDIVHHLNTVVPVLTDPLLQAKYVGFVAVASITVYELAVKDIFIEFSAKKNRVFGSFTESYFRRINGRIRIKTIKDDYVKRFGDKYLQRFERRLTKEKNTYLRQHRRDIVSSYSNLIVWRNDFAHSGVFSTSATYGEVVQSYEDGKEVIHCLAGVMNR
ncbi:MAG: HEPN domain-containing protein [Pseudomonadota bacterium]